MLKGIAASAGVSIGKAVVIRSAQLNVEKQHVASVTGEKHRYLDAVEVFIEELQQASEAVKRNVGVSEAGILSAQIAIIRDPALTKEVLRTIEREQVNAEYAFQSICNGYITLFSHLEDELISARAADFQDIRDRMLRILMGVRKVDLTSVPTGSILIAEDIPPSQAASISVDKVTAILTRKGTRFSHIAIISRALRLPAVVAVENLFDAVKGDELLIVDGHQGTVYIDPDDDLLAQYRFKAEAELRGREELDQYRGVPAVTSDGKAVSLAANLAVQPELEVIEESGADGVGLYRTEFLYMSQNALPGEEMQYNTYRNVAQAMKGKPVVIRTLDAGGDKGIAYLDQEPERNPDLGYRAIRFCLGRPDIFSTQLAALLRAAVHGDVRILLPMVSCLSELHQVKALIAEVSRDLAARGIDHNPSPPLGIMVETPAAVICATELAKEVDFFSIGTNDLTQYILAVDRGNDHVAALYSTLHPAVLRMIKQTVDAGHGCGIPVCVCGESASDPFMIPLLIGMGVDELSVNSSSLLLVRRIIHNLSHDLCRSCADRALTLSTAAQVRECVTGCFAAET